MGNVRKHQGHAGPALLMAAVAVLALLVLAGSAMAYGQYSHGTATTCHQCHPVSEAIPPTVKDCASCHTGYAVPTSSKTCYKCHTPGQDVQPIKTGVPTTCTATCHLADGTDHQHNPHPEKGTCTDSGCHNVTTSATVANGSPHHVAPAPALTTLVAKVSPTTVRLGRKVKVSGTAGPAASLARAKVAFRVDRKVGKKWVKMKTGSKIATATGTFAWNYKTLKKGSHRVTVSIAKTAKYTGKKVVKTFKVK